MSKGPYWDGESERERVVRELLEKKKTGEMSLTVNLILAVALALFALAFVWVCAALGATE